MRLWQKIYITVLLIFLPVLHIGLFMGARMIFNYNLEVSRSQASDEVHLLSRTIVKDIESLPYYIQQSDSIVYDVSGVYVEYVNNKDPNATLEIHYVGEKGDIPIGVQDVTIYDNGECPEIRVLELLEAPYESYELYYYKPLDDFYALWSSLKLVFMVIGLCCSIVLAVVLYVMLVELTAPLQRLTESVRMMQRGGGWDPVEVEGHDDITELTRSFNEMGAELEAQMEQLQRESRTKQQLVDDLAHEMRTPLTAIYGYAEYLQRVHCSEEERIDALDYIMSESKRLTQLGQSLLTMAVYREDEINAEEIKSTAIGKDISNLLAASLQEKRVKLILNVKQFTFEGDKSMLICLLRNLIENALRASECGKKIWLTMALQKGDVVIQVRDEGIGMEAHELERITDAFYRVDKARSRSNGGAGIGLNLCDLIVKKHAGHMKFESEVGKGTTVIVRIPAKIKKEQDEA